MDPADDLPGMRRRRWTAGGVRVGGVATMVGSTAASGPTAAVVPNGRPVEHRRGRAPRGAVVTDPMA